MNNGVKISKIIAELENKLLQNRKVVFENAIKSGGGFKVGAMTNSVKLRDANMKVIADQIPNIQDLITDEIDKSVTAGVSVVDKAVGAYNKQGKEFTKQSQERLNEAIAKHKQAKTNLAVASILNVLLVMTSMAQREFNQIVNLVDESKPNLYEEIDKVQASFLNKGVTGRVMNNGNEKEAFAESEFLVRDLSHKTMLEAQGIEAQGYGLQPLVMVSAHASSCPHCTKWQGRILVDDVYQGGVSDGKHELLSTAISDGLGHFNCRHNWVNYVENLDTPNLFDNEKLSKEKTAKTYAVEQQQRNIERNIREWKRRESASLSSVEQANAKAKVQEWQEVQRRLVKNAQSQGLSVYRQYSREQIGGETKPTLKL